MLANTSSIRRLRRLFLSGFTVMDVAESLASFDAERPARDVRAFMDAHDYDLIGIRTGGLVTGYAAREDLTGGRCGDHLQPFGPHDVVGETASLAETIDSLGINRRCFVRVLDRIAAIVTPSDLEKPPVRMYLFGMITITEMLMVADIERMHPGESWRDALSESRLQKALELQQERARRNQAAALLDCLQFSDKGQILLRDPAVRGELGFASRKEGLRALKELESLRNNLAHGQEIVPHDWDRIVTFSANMTRRLWAAEEAGGRWQAL